MKLDEFKKQKIAGREELFQKIMETFKSLNPVAIHQFGSGRYGYQDEFSDFDLWITFSDDKIGEIVQNREELFSKVAPILVKSDAPQNAPIGGSYTLVLYETDYGIFHVDYYLAPKSGSNIREDAKHLHGDNSLPRGEWVLDREITGKWTPEHVYDQILVMSYIMNKAIVRGGWNIAMAKYLRELYKDYQEIANQSLPPLPGSNDFEFIKELYKNILSFGNALQQKAVKKLENYSELVEKLYGSK